MLLTLKFEISIGIYTVCEKRHHGSVPRILKGPRRAVVSAADSYSVNVWQK